MYCTQCGCKIEDGYKFCPECGVEVVEIRSVDNQSDLDRLVDEICAKYPMRQPEDKHVYFNHDQRARALKELKKFSGLNSAQATDAIWMKLYGHTYAEMRKEKKENDKIRKAESKAQTQDNLQKIAAMGNMLSGRNKTVRCPKCGSTSISHGNKKLSLGRSAVGYGVAGPTGAILGGLSSKKGYAVCLNCGKQWKI